MHQPMLLHAKRRQLGKWRWQRMVGRSVGVRMNATQTFVLASIKHGDRSQRRSEPRAMSRQTSVPIASVSAVQTPSSKTSVVESGQHRQPVPTKDAALQSALAISATSSPSSVPTRRVPVVLELSLDITAK